MLRAHAQASGLYFNPEVPASSENKQYNWMIRMSNNAGVFPNCAVIGSSSPFISSDERNRVYSLLPDCVKPPFLLISRILVVFVFEFY